MCGQMKTTNNLCAHFCKRFIIKYTKMCDNLFMKKLNLFIFCVWLSHFRNKNLKPDHEHDS